MLSIHNLLSFSFALMIILLSQGCSAPKRLEAVPPNLQDKAVIPRMPDVRYWADKDTADFIHDCVEALHREQAYLAKSGYKGPLPVAEYLAISGGVTTAHLEQGYSSAGLLQETDLNSRPLPESAQVR